MSQAVLDELSNLFEPKKDSVNKPPLPLSLLHTQENQNLRPTLRLAQQKQRNLATFLRGKEKSPSPRSPRNDKNFSDFVKTKLHTEMSATLSRDKALGHNIFDPPAAAKYDLRRTRIPIASEDPLDGLPCSPHKLGAYPGSSTALLLEKDSTAILLQSVRSSKMDMVSHHHNIMDEGLYEDDSDYDYNEDSFDAVDEKPSQLIGVSSPMAFSSPSSSIPSEGYDHQQIPNRASRASFVSGRLLKNSPLRRPLPPQKPLAAAPQQISSPLRTLMTSPVASPAVNWLTGANPLLRPNSNTTNLSSPRMLMTINPPNAVLNSSFGSSTSEARVFRDTSDRVAACLQYNQHALYNPQKTVNRRSPLSTQQHRDERKKEKEELFAPNLHHFYKNKEFFSDERRHLNDESTPFTGRELEHVVGHQVPKKSALKMKFVDENSSWNPEVTQKTIPSPLNDFDNRTYEERNTSKRQYKKPIVAVL